MNKPSSAASEPEGTVTADEVAAYLRRNPDFLLRQPGLLSVLTPPSHRRGDNVVDMQGFMIERLGQEMERHRRAQEELIAASRRHLSSQSRVHGAVLDIMGASSFEQLIEIVTTDMAVRLDVDVVVLCVETDGRTPPVATRTPGVRVVAAGTVDAVLGSDRQVLLRTSEERLAPIFGGAADLVASEALLRLTVSPKAPPGLLALGSRDVDRFNPGRGTELLNFLARVIESTIRTWLGLPA